MTQGVVFGELEIHNGLTYKDIKLNLEKQGLVFVRGVNNDTKKGIKRSNGSGKSAFSDVLEHILYESTSRGLKKDEIMRAGASEGYLGKLILKTPKGQYLIQQSRKHAKYGTGTHVFQKFEHGIEEISHVKNINKTQELIQNELLKLTEQQFHGAVCISQDAGHPLVNGTGAECAKYLTSTFGFDIYDNIRGGIKEQIDKMQEHVAQVDVYLETLKEIDDKLEAYKDTDYILETSKSLKSYYDFGMQQLQFMQEKDSDLSKMVGYAERRDELQASLAVFDTRNLDDLNTSLKKKESFYQNLSSQLTEINNQLSLLKAQENVLRELAVCSSTKESLLSSLNLTSSSDVGEALSLCISDLESRTSLSAKLLSLGKEISFLEKHTLDPVFGVDLPAVEEEIVFQEEKLPELLSQSSQLLKLENLSDPVCPTCGQEIDENHKEQEIVKAKKAKKQLDTVNLNLNSFKKVRSDIQYYLETCAKIEATVKQAGIAVSSDLLLSLKSVKEYCSKESVSILNKKRMTLKEIQDLETTIKIKQDNILGFSSEDNSSLEELKALLTSLTSKKEEVQLSIDNTKRHKSLLEDLNKLPLMNLTDLATQKLIVKEELDEIRSSLKTVQEYIHKFEGDARSIKDLTMRRIQTSAYIDKHQNAYNQLTWLKQLYKGLAKLKVRKLRTVVETVKNILPKYIGIMFHEEDITFELDNDDPESVVFWATRPHPTNAKERVRIPVKALSKGEKAGLRVSLLWTLKDILQPEKSCDLLILDEADNGLDEQGLEAFCTLLDKIRDQYGTVIVISHRKELFGVSFDQIWTFTKTNGITEVDAQQGK